MLIFAVIYNFFVRKLKFVNQKSLLIIKLDGIGDYVLFRNFIETLKSSKKYSGYKITLCGNILWKDLAVTLDKDYIDEFIWIDTKTWNSIIHRLKFFRFINRKGFEVAIQPTISRKYFEDYIIKASNARERLGSVGNLNNISRLHKKHSDKFYTKLIPLHENNFFEFYANINFFESILKTKIHIKKPLINITNSKLKWQTTNKYIVIFPGAGHISKIWNVDNFARICKHLITRYGIDIFITGGKKEMNISKQILNIVKDSHINNLTGKISLYNFIEILRNAELLISNETCAVHIGVALNIITICISNGNSFSRFHPYPKSISDKAFYVYPKEIMDNIDNFNLLALKYRNGSSLDIDSINVEEVIKMIDKVISNQNLL